MAILIGCGTASTDKKDNTSSRQDLVKVDVPEFNKDSAYYYVEKQVEFGPRVPGTRPNALCAEYLIQTLKRFTPHVKVQQFKARLYNKEVLQGKNIIATFNPEVRKRVLLCAHWDSRPYADHDPNPANHNTPIDGANDGASGTGVLLEIARQLSMHPIKIGIDIILFDMEDYGQPQGTQQQVSHDWALGSQYWSKNPHIRGYRADYGILLDMVGGYDPSFTREGTSDYYAPHIFDKVWGVARQIGYGDVFPNRKTPNILDDHYYINEIAKIPTIDIIHWEAASRTGFFKHWHTVNDNMDGIDRETLGIVGQVVLTVIYQE